jgi:4-amino-4-deoxy-L-arabinose transferase-like glycosyltransferase
VPILSRDQEITSVRATDSLPVFSVGIVALFIVIANIIFICVRLNLPYPLDPWEAGIVTDAWRMLQGEAIYDLGANHATHIYGPLITVILAKAFAFTGPSLQVGRTISAISGLAVVVLLAAVFGGKGRLAFGVSAALLLAANSRTGSYFTDTRPDMDSIFCALLALIVLYQGQKAQSTGTQVILTLAGSALMAIAVMFKQPAAIFAFVPALTMAKRYEGLSYLYQLLLAAVPILGVVLTLGAIYLFFPGVWHFIVLPNTEYRISIFRMARMTVEFLTSVPLFLIALMHWFYTDVGQTWRLRRVRWLLAAMICAIPTSLAALAKEGGAANSLIPALLAVGAFCAWRTPEALTLLRDDRRSLLLRVLVGVLLSVLLFAHAYPVPGALSEEALQGGYGVADRAKVIAEIRLLPGRVICPDDPTIVLAAKNYAGRSAVFEADAVHWNPSRAQALLNEIDSADYVIKMQHGLSPDGKVLVAPPLGWGMTDDVLQARGFIKTGFQTTFTPVYELWQRSTPPSLRN